MDPNKFARISESLRQYRRAELKDFQRELGAAPVDVLYVDPLPGNAILNSVLSSNTTFLIGRKGTGKSTVFAKAQIDLRKRRDILSTYIDVNALYELISPEEIKNTSTEEININPGIYRAHLLRKAFLGTIICQLIKEIENSCNSLSFLEVWKGIRRSYRELQESLKSLGNDIKNARLEKHEIPILQKITAHWKNRDQKEYSTTDTTAGSAAVSLTNAKVKFDATITDFDKTLEDSEIYNEYSEVVLRAFPFGDLLNEIQDLLDEAGMSRLVVFFDDFSELSFVDQRLFVDVLLTPLNNSSNESVKLKIAGYPGRIYYGKIDPSKVDTISLDFSSLYEATEVQEMERSAIDYAYRLLKTRFEAFGEEISDYFDSSAPLDDHIKLIFQTTFNVPRLMGALLHICFLDKVSKGSVISLSSFRLASLKYYESTISQYFNRMMRYALEPFENKLDRHNQQELLKFIIAEARNVRKKIQDGHVGGTYFKDITNPPVSHFIVSPSLEPLFRSLEANFLLSKYKDTRDKNGEKVVVYAMYYGATEAERMSWGYPSGRKYRNYFVQRCFDYSRAIHEFLSQKQTIRCNHCGRCYPVEKKDSFEMFHWGCPECKEGLCSMIYLAEEFESEVKKLQKDIMLEPVELDMLNVLSEENKRMRAGEISALLDVTYQLVGKRTSKLQELNLVEKTAVKGDRHIKSEITERAKNTYFN